MPPLVALQVRPADALGAAQQGQRHALGMQRAQLQNEGLKQDHARQAMEMVGSVALGAMGGSMEGEVNPEHWEQGLDFLEQNGFDASPYRGNPEAARMMARGSLSTIQQLQNARSEQEMELALRKFDAQMQQWAEQNSIARERLNIARQAGDAGPRYSTTPQLIETEDGLQWVQFADDGTYRRVEGVTPAETITKIDTGTGTVLIGNKSAEPRGEIAKDLSGKKEQETVGKVRGEARMNLPGAQIQLDRVKSDIDNLFSHKNWRDYVGRFDSLPSSLPKTAQSQSRIDFNADLEKVRSQTFTAAYETLKGAGQITEFETQSAARALANMDEAQSDKQFERAVKSFMKAVEDGYRKIAAQAGDANDSGWRDVGNGVRIRKQ